MKYHPDKVKGSSNKAAEDRFKEINEAYTVISDQTKRRLYDHGGYSAVQRNYSSNINYTTHYSNFNGKSKKARILEKVKSHRNFVIADFARELNVQERNLRKILEMIIVRKIINGKIQSGMFIRA